MKEIDSKKNIKNIQIHKTLTTAKAITFVKGLGVKAVELFCSTGFLIWSIKAKNNNR